MDEISRLLKEGIQAVKAGKREQAKALLMQVIEADEANEQAWLWLSGAVDTDEERRICLENVLTINPSNALAQKGLSRLKPVAKIEVDDDIELPASFTEEEEVDEPLEVFLPPSLEARAAQAVQPEPKEEAGWWVEKKVTESPKVAPPKKYYDVWANQADMCAYCAAPIDRLQSRCPQCNNQLIVKSFINPVPSKHHGRLFSWIIINSVVYIGIALYNSFFTPLDCIDLGRNTLLTVVSGSLLPQIAIAVGVYQRQVWAYWVLLVRAILEAGFWILLSFDIAAIMSEIGATYFFIGIRDIPCFSFVTFLVVLVLMIVLLNVYIIYMAGEDFKRIPVRRLATINDRLRDPVLLDKVAQRLATEGQWASAVLHWQRAVGSASGHAPYLLRLGHAFAELGFYERSIDILQSALDAARNSETRQEIEKEMVRTKRLSEGMDPRQAV